MPEAATPWPPERAQDWSARHPLPIGFNYLPRTAVNWTELWHRESFDLPTIEQELSWAADIGFDSLRTTTTLGVAFSAA